MDRKKLLIRLTSLVFFIFIVNYLAVKFYWYYSIWWFDMPMHFLGGVWLSLAILWFFPVKDLSMKSISMIILSILSIGVLWELYEILVNNLTAQIPFNTLDTISDVCFDLAAGFSALIYYCYTKTNG